MREKHHVRHTSATTHGDLVVRGVTKEYLRGTTRVPALQGIDLGLPAGCQIALMGPSGCGKTTLLHCMAGIIKPTSGSITLADTDITSLGERARSQLRLDQFGFVFQDDQLLPELTGEENIALPLMLSGRSRSDAIASANGILDQLGLRELSGSRPGQMSGGQAQRIAIARALVTNPAVVFADEPTGALDQATGREIMNLLIQSCGKTGATLVLVTHDPGVAAMLPHTIRMKDGLIQPEGDVR
ncbi:MAG: ABC transporter ATP-binding protein [Actinomycetaceae bacterium]|nr:ABC transporter ATP-binding protein [Actinomycetaceae bacterium]